MKTKRERNFKTRGFTLVEILVVIVIISILASILLTVLSRTREKGRSSVCQNNLAQVRLAIQQYVQDYDGKYPGLTSLTAWAKDIGSYVKSSKVFICPSHNPNAPDNNSVDYMYNFHRLSIFRDPLDSSKTLSKGRHEIEILNTETTWLNTDDDLYAQIDKLVSTCGRKFSWHTMHSGGANYSFIDGHIKWLTPQQMSKIECLNGPLPAPFTQIDQ